VDSTQRAAFRGRLEITEPHQHHRVLLDGDATVTLISPYAVEPYPRLLTDDAPGSFVQWLPDEPDDIATVMSVHSHYHDPTTGRIAECNYKLARYIYARRRHVARETGSEPARVGDAVRILHPHIESGGRTGDDDSYKLIRTCEECDSLEIMHTFWWPHTALQVVAWDETAPEFCPANHAYKCPCLGHGGECYNRDDESLSLCGSLPQSTHDSDDDSERDMEQLEASMADTSVGVLV
jgi:hypothetical protein